MSKDSSVGILGQVQLFIVERYLAGWSAADVQQLLDRTSAHAAAMAADGVRHVGSVFIPGDETCLCLFSGPSSDAVRAANERHDLPFGRVVDGELSGTAPFS
jgi:Nickel responsive protein SCO4226-like